MLELHVPLNFSLNYIARLHGHYYNAHSNDTIGAVYKVRHARGGPKTCDSL